MKIQSILIRTLIAGSMLLAATGIRAQTPDTNQPPKTTEGRSASKDTKFLQEANRANLTGIQLGQLASQQSANPAVKQFGQKLVQDHTAANQQLTQIAQNMGTTLPTQLQKHEQHQVEHLQSLSGDKFDQAFLRDYIKDDQKVIHDFDRESKSNGNPDLKQYAANTLPTLQSNLDQARNLSSQAKGPAVHEPAGKAYNPGSTSQ